MTSTRRKLTLIISAYENPQALDALFTRLVKGSRLPDQVVVADDGSGAGTKGVVDSWRARAHFPVKHVWHTKEGYRRARIINLAISVSSGDYLVFMDGDSLPQKHFIADHYALAQEGCFLQGGRANIGQAQVEPILEDRRTILGAFLRGQLHGLRQAIRLPKVFVQNDNTMDAVCGGNLAIWRDDLVAINGFDETYQGWGLEDCDITARLYNLGRTRKLVQGKAVLFHLSHVPLSRADYEDNHERLQEAIEHSRTHCDCGLDQHVEHELQLDAEAEEEEVEAT